MVSVFKANFNYISAISWGLYLLVEETGVTRENQRPVASHWRLEFVKILIFIRVGYIQRHCQKNKKIKWADQFLPKVYDTTLKET
jgi:hypothetical protein